jgi:hypothetical protein
MNLVVGKQKHLIEIGLRSQRNGDRILSKLRLLIKLYSNNGNGPKTFYLFRFSFISQYSEILI